MGSPLGLMMPKISTSVCAARARQPLHSVGAFERRAAHKLGLAHLLDASEAEPHADWPEHKPFRKVVRGLLLFLRQGVLEGRRHQREHEQQ